MQDLQGKVAVITGGASGIGLAMAHRFAADGMKLLLVDIEAGALDDAAAELRDAGAEVHTSITDVSSEEQMDVLRDDAFDTYGTVHVVCNNAGVGSGGMLSQLTTKDWEWCLGVNLWGVIHGLRCFLPRLMEQNEGHVVNTASVAGMFAAPFMGPYNASKYAVVAISETLYQEVTMTQSEVGVSVLCPAWVRTRIHESDRNRPDELRNAVDPELEAQGSMMRDMLKGVIEAGMDPAAVADRVANAVRNKELYILTHDDSKKAIEARMNAILEGGYPPFFMPQ